MEYKLLPPLKQMRIARSLSQDELAGAIGTNANTISRWERGVATPSPYFRRKLAELFEIDPQKLLLDLSDDEGSSMGYVNIDIHVIRDDQEENAYLVTASTTPRRKDAVSERFSLLPTAWQSLEPNLGAIGAKNAITHNTYQKMNEFGKQLFNCLFSGKVRHLYDNKRQDAINTSKTLRLRLILVPLDLIVLPWELLFDERYSEYLCLTQQPKTILIRSIEDVTHKRDNSSKYNLPLHILGVMANPKNLSSLQSQSEKKIAEEALQELITDKKVDLTWKTGRISELDDLLYSRDRLDVFHFIGHVRFDAKSRQGQLAFEDEKRRSKFISTERLQASLHPTTKLVVLDACETPRKNPFDCLSNIAHNLATQKIPAVVATQFHILDAAANRFAKIFYMLLAKGTAVDEAVAEARREIHKTAEDRDRLDWAAPILYISSSNSISFKTDPRPVATTRPSVDEEQPSGNLLPLSGCDTEPILSLSEREVRTSPLPGEPVPPRYPSRRRFKRKLPLWLHIVLAIIGIALLAFGSGLVFPSFLSKPLPDLFPALCSGNFQSTNTSIVPTPPTSVSPDGELIGLSEGATILDLQRSNPQEVRDKLQAAQDWVNNPQDVVSSLRNAISLDQTDAEAQIYLEDWRVLGSNHPHITFVVGVSFMSSFQGGARGTLQGAYTAQKECNNQNQQDESKTQVVLMIANIGGPGDPDDLARNATFVANQIADQANRDKTIIGIVGWNGSASTINVNHQLKVRGSGLPMVSPSASSDELQGMSNFFRICPPNKEEAQMAADFMLKKERKRKIAILFDKNTSYANNLKNDFATDIQNNMLVSASFTGSDSQKVQDALTNVLAQNPDAIFFAGYIPDLFELLKNIHSTPKANNLLIVGGDALASTNDYVLHFPDMYNVYFTAFASPNEWDGTGHTPPFFQYYQNNFGTPPTPTGLPSIDANVMLAYDALSTLLHGSQQVLSKQNTINASDLTKSLREITDTNAFQGITGRIAFKANGDPQDKKVILEYIEETQLKVDKNTRRGCFLVRDDCSAHN